MSWMIWVLFVGLLWIYPVCVLPGKSPREETLQRLKKCLKDLTAHVVADNFYGVISTENWNLTKGCIVFLQKNPSKHRPVRKIWPQIEKGKNYFQLLVSKWHINQEVDLNVLDGWCSLSDLRAHLDGFSHSSGCQIRSVLTQCKKSIYAENSCKNNAPQNRYIINLTEPLTCINCDNPVKQPEKEIVLNETLTINEGEKLDGAQAVRIMDKMADIAASINGSSASLKAGEGVTGILVRETEPEEVEEVSLAYDSPEDSLKIVEEDNLPQFSRSITVSKEAFEKAVSLNISIPFAAVFRFLDLTSDEMNSVVLGNEVIAVEMGTIISNLTDKMSINFRNMKYEGTPSCQSWNGEGRRPNWTNYGCLTVINGDNITCECSHLTFFAILLTPPNVTMSSSDLKSLTIITQVGCAMSVFFLSVILFIHFLFRKNKASIATKILINLVIAMLLLNLTFLTNNYVARLKNSLGCKIMAALMHYFMLATFTWFAAQAFHLCLQLYKGGKIIIRHYILRVAVTSWVLPSVVVIVLFITEKYGEQVINTDTEDDTTMCWITDNNVHYIVNIGYYALVFVFTFTTFITILSWVFHLKRMRNAEKCTNGKSIVVILGLCCILGISWGFAFFAYGVLRIPAYYIFTVLNSLQGFFLFIYYYNTHRSEQRASGASTFKISNTTLQTGLNSIENPFAILPDKEKKP